MLARKHLSWKRPKHWPVVMPLRLVVADATDALNRALEELERLGFDADDLAQLLGTDASELISTSPTRRSSSRRSRSSPTVDDPLASDLDVNETDSPG